MSNPAVIQLSSTYINDTEVRIEDNWAEAIHLHFGCLRIDLTVKEFLDIADKMALAANQIIEVDEFDVNEFDPVFLNHYAETLMDLESITKDFIKLGDIIALKYYRLPLYRHLDKCRDYQALNGNTKQLDHYDTQINIIGQTNMQRLENVMESVKRNGYPYNDEFIILRNNQNVIMDGQHRASCLLYLYGKDYKVPVMRFHYHNNKYNIKDWHPWKKAVLLKAINQVRRVLKKILHIGHIDF